MTLDQVNMPFTPRDDSDDHLLDVFEPTLVKRMLRDLQRQNNLKNNSPSSSPTRGSAGETEQIGRAHV